MNPLLVIGSLGHAKSVIDVCESQGEYTIIGLLDHSRAKGEKTLAYDVLGGDEVLSGLLAECPHVFVAVGHNHTRAQIVRKLQTIKPHAIFPTLIHPAATISRHAILGQGTVVMAGAVVNAGTKIGAHCIVNTSASIDHDCSIGDFAAIGPGAVLSGSVSVGQCSWVGIGSCVREKIRIENNTVIGAGSVVVSNIPSLVVAFGSPCRVIGHRETSSTYLK